MRGIHVFFLFVLWFCSLNIAVYVAATMSKPADGYREATIDHPLAQFIRSPAATPAAVLVVFVVGCVIAPLTEEFLFRFALQGCLTGTLKSGTAAVIATSLLFAGMHAGTRSEQTPDELFAMFVAVGVAGICVLIAGAGKLVPQKNCWTLKGTLHITGLFLLTVPVIYFIGAVAHALQPETVIDPLPLFFFSLVLGFVYRRCGQLVPCVLMHAAFNTLGFMIGLYCSQ